ncbi:putative OB-fold protein [Actinoplanes octamycinicus]|uniref:Putative OB-fold protein n=1 Tax=Actinoplanes octamycinicus TaxID=135948 RepID=A0A7W7MCM3_9ACTN|nr:putative OB-fold protein [Actinoplanes octamycinicus]GIE62274.1 hypothetical protein Aoc01nite_76760 [Actinoplanes octamycinicus]
MTATIEAAAQSLAASGWSPARLARDPVNRPAIRDWLAAIGDGSPVYERDRVAPPAMVQVWTMPGLGPRQKDPLGVMSAVLDEAGYPSVVATDCAQTYHRYLRDGEMLSVRSRLTGVTGPKRTALGEGWFVTTASVWEVAGEPVAEMTFRVLKYRPGTPAAAPRAEPLRPAAGPDTAFFWAGIEAGELRIQSCLECGALRHPPGPACPACGALKPSYVVAAGTGTIHSYVVHHHPPLPGRRSPVTVALVDLDEGVRMVAELRGMRPSIGARVQAGFAGGLPVWRPVGVDLPSWELVVTPTVIISSALATRDFQDVHHDRDAAVRRGSRDIFLNILTTTGLVQRYVTDWAGPEVVLRGIDIRLGTPCFAYDTLTFTGQSRGAEVAVAGRTAAGEHVAGIVRVAS